MSWGQLMGRTLTPEERLLLINDKYNRSFQPFKKKAEEDFAAKKIVQFNKFWKSAIS